MKLGRSLVGWLSVGLPWLVACGAPALPSRQFVIGCPTCRVPVMISSSARAERTRGVSVSSTVRVDEMRNSYDPAPADALARQVRPDDRWLELRRAEFWASDETESSFLFGPPQGYSGGTRQFDLKLGAHP